MDWRNTREHYGWVSVSLHWLMLLLLIAVYACLDPVGCPAFTSEAGDFAGATSLAGAGGKVDACHFIPIYDCHAADGLAGTQWQR